METTSHTKQQSRKALIRKDLKQKRQQLTPAQLHQADVLFALKLKTHPAFLRAKRVAFYIEHQGEVPMQSAVQLAWAMGKQVALPLVHPLHQNKMVFKYCTQNTPLKTNQWQLLEPQLKEPSAYIGSLDCVIMPLVGFDQTNNRLGQGGGFYDRAFSRQKQQQYGRLPTLIGAAYDFQELADIETQAWDVSLDGLIIV